MRKLALAALVGIVSSPAHAHWQYTTWGMTPEQVIAASGGSLVPGDCATSAQDNSTKGAVGEFVAGDYRSSASFWFKPSGLSTVSLALRSAPQCMSLQRDLLAKYGEPVEQSGASVQRRMWADRDNDNRVTFINTGLSYCELQYAPLVSASASAL